MAADYPWAPCLDHQLGVDRGGIRDPKSQLMGFVREIQGSTRESVSMSVYTHRQFSE